TLSALNSYASNSTVTLIESLDSMVTANGLFGNFAQAQSVGTNSLGTQFYLNYFGGVDGNDVVLQTTLPGSLTTGLVWNVAGAAAFTSGFASSNGNFGVGTFPADPFASGVEDLFLGHNGTATLSTSGTAGSLQVGTNEAQARIAGRNGNGTLTATGSANLTLTSSGASGDLLVGRGVYAGTVNWGSTGTLEAQGRLRVGEEAAGTFNQTDGVVIGGNSATGAYVGVGVGDGGDGTYNLNNGALRPSGGLAGTEFRQTNVGYEGGEGELNVGDGVGAAGSAVLESNDDLWIGRAGGTGVMNVKADGRVHLQTSTNNAELHVGEGTAAAPGHGTVVQTGGTVTSDALVRIGAGPGSVGSYTISGGSFTTATDGTGAFQIARNGATGTVRVEGTGSFNHGAELFVANEQNSGSIGRLELIGSAGSVTIGQLENAPGGANGMSETIRWEADAGGVISMVITGAGPASFDAQLQDPNELAANTGAGDTLMGDGIALELDLAAIIGDTSLTLIDNQSIGEPITGFFENGSSMDLYEEGAAITGTGYAGTVNISYIGGDGNDVVLNLVAGAVNSADFDDDGDVDGRDLLAWQRGLGATGASPSQGDANGDGNVTSADLDIWKDQFGPGAATPVAAAVPEPAALSLAMAAVCLAGMAARRRN
ncbi:MAG TPA: dockerin type I domain-containing protein, partial [Lacipirellula sp.]